jgi:hypothetical protein
VLPRTQRAHGSTATAHERVHRHPPARTTEGRLGPPTCSTQTSGARHLQRARHVRWRQSLGAQRPVPEQATEPDPAEDRRPAGNEARRGAQRRHQIHQPLAISSLRSTCGADATMCFCGCRNTGEPGDGVALIPVARTIGGKAMSGRLDETCPSTATG